MITPTPETLREVLYALTLSNSDRVKIRAAADAWDVALLAVKHWKAVADASELRLAEADHALRKYGDHMTYCKGNMDAPCTCGYHDVCKPAVKRSEGRQAWK